MFEARSWDRISCAQEISIAPGLLASAAALILGKALAHPCEAVLLGHAQQRYAVREGI